MDKFLGIDIGTTKIKLLVLNQEGEISLKRTMGVFPQFGENGVVEINPYLWIKAVIDLSKESNLSDVKVIGLSGQMHTLVLLNKKYVPIRNAIVWADSRGKEEETFLNENFGNEILTRCGSIPATSFTLIKLFYLLKHNELPKETYKFCLPKDFIGGWLTGIFDTDRTDASATLMYSINKNDWYFELIKKLGIEEFLFPNVNHSLEIRGYLKKEVAELLGMKEGIPVLYGAGDQEAAAYGSNVVEPGEVMISLSTGGQIVIPVEKPILDRRIHNFCHVNGFHIMGAIQNFGLTLNWAVKVFGFQNFDELTFEALNSVPGANGVIFLPYIVPERTPIMNSNVASYFINLKAVNSRSDIARSILEGVSFTIIDAWNTLNDIITLKNPFIFILGGASQNKIIKEIIFSFLKGNINIFDNEFDSSCYGAALMAGEKLGNFDPKNKYSHKFIKESFFRNDGNDEYIRFFNRFLDTRKEILGI
ncbi:MAG: FGGY family carbohydrate kinase [Nitrososphaeria archaeon]|nr:FGGY family carbohydrate kinase [Candidatus Jingweiarchaeum tengchongense]